MSPLSLGAPHLGPSLSRLEPDPADTARSSTKRTPDARGSWSRDTSPAKRLAQPDCPTGDEAASPITASSGHGLPLTALDNGRVRVTRLLRPMLQPEWRASASAAEPSSEGTPTPPLTASSDPSPSPSPPRRLARTLTPLTEDDDEETSQSLGTVVRTYVPTLPVHPSTQVALEGLAVRSALLPPHWRVSRDALVTALPWKTPSWQVAVLNDFSAIVARNPAMTPHLPQMLTSWSYLLNEERRVLLVQLSLTRHATSSAALGTLLRDDVAALVRPAPAIRRRLALFTFALGQRDVLPLSAWSTPLARVRGSDHQLAALATAVGELAPPDATIDTLVPLLIWLAGLDAGSRRSMMGYAHALLNLAHRSSNAHAAMAGVPTERIEARHVPALVATWQHAAALRPAQRDALMVWLETMVGDMPLAPSMQGILEELATLVRLVPLAQALGIDAKMTQYHRLHVAHGAQLERIPHTDIMTAVFEAVHAQLQQQSIKTRSKNEQALLFETLLGLARIDAKLHGAAVVWLPAALRGEEARRRPLRSVAQALASFEMAVSALGDVLEQPLSTQQWRRIHALRAGAPLTRADAAFVAIAGRQAASILQEACAASIGARERQEIVVMGCQLLQLPATMRPAALNWLEPLIHLERFTNKPLQALRYAQDKLQRLLDTPHT